MTEQLTDHEAEAVTILSEEECWQALRKQSFGHLAYTLAGEIGIVPLNYMVSDDRIVFRTAEGSKLLGLTINDSVVFEVDEIGSWAARTVIVRGHATQLSEAEEDAFEGLKPWVPTLKYNVVAITPSVMTGRSFRLDRP